jgi:hypothetical protein
VPNLVKVYVESADDLLNAGMYDAGAIVRLQSCATEAGVYVNESTAALVSGTQTYTLYDADGASTTWYRTRYENAGGTVTSDWSAVFQVGGETAGYLCSLYDVKQRLGITGTAYDEELAELIRQVTAEIERLTDCDFTGDRSDGTYVLDVPYTSRTLWVTRGIQSVTTLSLATTDQPDTGGTYTATTEYRLRPVVAERGWAGAPATRIIFPDSASSWFQRGFGTVQLVGKLGWASVPPEVERIAASAVVAQHMTKGSEGPRAVVGPDGRATILRDISPADYQTLLAFRGPWL